jgi:two-component system alkaline phosphatase synthesis response regulator PhoP/two-component system response regulator VicR
MPKILAVDDQVHIVRLIQVNLERNGYQVVTAYDGQQALDKIKTENPDLVVCDVMMPRKDGFEVLREVRSEAGTRDLPFIMLTAKAQDADLLRGYKSGADCYLTKPFNPNELLGFVKRVLESAHGKDEFGGDTVYRL